MVQGRKMPNKGPDEILDFYTSFERSLYKLSENQKNFDIGSTVLKLGQITEYANFGPIPWIIAHAPRPKNDKLGLLPTYGLKYMI